MIPVHIQQFPVKLSGGHKFRPVQEKMGNPKKVGTIDKSNRPKKPNNRRKRQGKHPVPPILKYVRKQISDLPKSLFCFEAWDGKMMIPPAFLKGGHVLDIADYSIVDCSQKADTICVDPVDGTFVAAKLSATKSSKLGDRRYWTQIRKMMITSMSNKPDIKRGPDCKGVHSRYICFGYRKEQTKSGVLGEYAFNRDCKKQTEMDIKKQVEGLVSKMENTAATLTSKLPEYAHFKKCQKALSLPTVASGDNAAATQFSAGRDYWSQAHTDPDYYFTLLSALSADPKDHKEILHYFCFPEYNLKIPVRSTELILFNPAKVHSCSNCKFPGSYIYSAYVSEKTVMTAGIGLDMHN